MNKSSIFYSITFIFSISIISIFLALLFLLEYDKQQYTDKLNAKYSVIARATLFHLNNFITTVPKINERFIYPLDFDLAFTKDEYINIDL